jgi:DNA polymerase-1
MEWAEGAGIACIGVAVRPDLVFVAPIHHPQSPWEQPSNVLSAIGHALMFTSAKTIAHNAKFDDRWLHHYGFDHHTDFDTMIAAHLLDENQFKGLKVLGPLFLGVDPWKNIDLGIKEGAFSVPLRKLARYNAKDAAYTLRLYSLFRKELLRPGNERTLRIFAKLMMPASRAITHVERNGLWVDRKRLSERLIQANETLAKLNRKMSKLCGEEINWNSTQQLSKILFQKLGLPIGELTEGGSPSTKEAVLLSLRSSHPIVKVLLEWRKWKKWQSTYLVRWAQVIANDGRLHPNYKITGTVTGRLASGKDEETAKRKERGLNAQQIPRDSFIRGIIGAPPGWTFVEADFSQIELRIVAHVSRDATMARLFAQGEDIHLATAVQVTGKLPKHITKEERKKAKSVNFGYCFGMWWKKYIIYARDNYDLEVSEEEAQLSRKRFFEVFQALKPWHDRQRRLAQLYHRVSSPIGRVRHLPDILSGDKEVRGEAERQAINSPVQSLASDMMLLALVILDSMMPPSEAKIVGSVHDALLFEIRDDVVDKWVPIIRRVMENLPLEEKFGLKFSIPIVVDITAGKHWSEGKKVA